ncbi:45566_t:CDS:2 [Gigaspora margarita]|uniref:45566_t:CDS:1 n=1 Tax=Gigaspora margarita TaxID=4874 RepID=A0ABM8VZ74_GIGMA|nr:45566_t:CDS:2 [Gigaspora margarita]
MNSENITGDKNIDNFIKKTSLLFCPFEGYFFYSPGKIKKPLGTKGVLLLAVIEKDKKIKTSNREDYNHHFVSLIYFEDFAEFYQQLKERYNESKSNPNLETDYWGH